MTQKANNMIDHMKRQVWRPRHSLRRMKPARIDCAAQHARAAVFRKRLNWSKYTTQIAQCADQRLDVRIVVVEVEARPNIVVSIRRDDLSFH